MNPDDAPDEPRLIISVDDSDNVVRIVARGWPDPEMNKVKWTFQRIDPPDGGVPAAPQEGGSAEGPTVEARAELEGSFGVRRGARPPQETGRALDFFALLWTGEARENIRAAAANLRKDVREMRAAGWSAWHVLGVRFWRTTTTIVPIAWDGLARAVRAVMAVVRRIDPPRLG